MRIYCDGIFDLFHKGHLEHFKKIHQYFKIPIHLIVGIISDKVAINYKRKPVFNEKKRLKIIESILYVKETFITDTLVLDENFFDKYKIDYIVHAFNDPSDKNKQNSFFEYAISVNKFIEIDYNMGTSTTKIIESYYGTEMMKKHEKNLKWNEIWENKGLEDTSDLYILNGWENTVFDPHKLIDKIINTLYINKDEKILEIGCGAGLLSTFLKEYDYFGLDYSITLVSKHIQLLNNIVINFSCTDIIFKDNYFDYIIVNSTLEYLNSNDELNQTISEIERITKKGIYIANIPHKLRTIKIDRKIAGVLSHTIFPDTEGACDTGIKHKYDGAFSHFVINKEYFSKLCYKIMDSLYDKDKYDVYKIK